jgi:hypothetical protein
MAVKKKETVEWTYNNIIVDNILKTPEGSLAFIYKISLLDGTGRYYYGRKTMWKPRYTSGKNKGISKGLYVWRTYCGSSKELTELIKGNTPYKKEILKFCFSKAETTYEETKQILCGGGLTDPLCLNFWIKSLIYSKHLEPNS